MKKLLLAGVVLTQALAFSAFAQQDAVGNVAKPAPYSKVSPEDRAAARAKRKAETPAAVESQGEVGSVRTPKRSNLTKEERAAARAKRRADMAAANKAGKISRPGAVNSTE